MSALTSGQMTSIPSPPAAPGGAAITSPVVPASVPTSVPTEPAAAAAQYQSLAGCLTLSLVTLGAFVVLGVFVALFGNIQ